MGDDGEDPAYTGPDEGGDEEAYAGQCASTCGCGAQCELGFKHLDDGFNHQHHVPGSTTPHSWR